jgi:hypothetical protein
MAGKLITKVKPGFTQALERKPDDIRLLYSSWTYDYFKGLSK